MISEVRFNSTLSAYLPTTEAITSDTVPPTSTTAPPIIIPEVIRSTTTDPRGGGVKPTNPDSGSGQRVTDRVIPGTVLLTAVT